MKVIWQKETAGSRIVALGTFDGVHRGHRELLDAAIRYARENRIQMRVCTFDRHPLEVIRPEFAPKILTTIPERAGLLAQAGADEMSLIRFRREIADMEPEEFLAMLRGTVHLRAVAAGWNYTFGRLGRGTADMLREDGKRHGYDVLIQPPVTMEDGTPVSSSVIREKISAGKIREAEELLGHEFEVSGRIPEEETTTDAEEFRILVPARKQLPAGGNYSCLVKTRDGLYVAAVSVHGEDGAVAARLLPETAADIAGMAVRLVFMDRLHMA